MQFDRALPTPTPPGLFSLDIGTSEKLDLNMNGGDDTVTADAGLDPLGFTLDVDGGDGNDVIDGGDGADLLKGGNGDDRITPDDNPVGTRDDARGDAGDDTIIWNGGDDDDLNDGGDGNDTSQVNGAAVGETFTVKPGANGHVIFDRTPPTPTPVPGFFNIDMSTTERLDLNMNAGDDTVTADPGFASLALDVDGGDGNDIIDGGDAADILEGGNGDDRIVPDDNPAGTRDVAHGDAGDDTIIWNGGDDDDINDGGDGNDTSVVNGATAAERFTIKPGAPGRVRFDRTSTNPAPFNIDIGTTELLRLNANGGDDRILGFEGVAGLIKTELNGEDGNDEIRGTDAEDRINAGKGFDIVNSRDQAEDLLDCGTGLDLAVVDRRDFLRNCNIVLGGLLRVQVPHKVLHAANGEAALRLKCAGTKRCKGVAKLRSGGKTLATAHFNIKKGAKTVHLDLNRKGQRLMASAPAKGRSMKLQIDAQGREGQRLALDDARHGEALVTTPKDRMHRGRPHDAGGLVRSSDALVRRDDHAGGRRRGAGELERRGRDAGREQPAPGAQHQRVDRQDPLVDQVGAQQRLDQVAAAEHDEVDLPLERGHGLRGVALEQRRVDPLQRLLQRPRRDVLLARVEDLGERIAVGLLGPEARHRLVGPAAEQHRAAAAGCHPLAHEAAQHLVGVPRGPAAVLEVPAPVLVQPAGALHDAVERHVVHDYDLAHPKSPPWELPSPTTRTATAKSTARTRGRPRRSACARRLALAAVHADAEHLLPQRPGVRDEPVDVPVPRAARARHRAATRPRPPVEPADERAGLGPHDADAVRVLERRHAALQPAASGPARRSGASASPSGSGSAWTTASARVERVIAV